MSAIPAIHSVIVSLTLSSDRLPGPSDVGFSGTDERPSRPLTNSTQPDARDPSAEREKADQRLVQSIAWTGAMRWLSQVLTWAITLMVARILTPEDYGLVGMAAVFFGLVNLVNDFGLSTAIVVVRDLDGRQVAHINGLAVIIGVFSCATFCALAVPIGAFYGVDALPPIVVVMSLSFLITAFRGIPQGMLEKNLRFKRIALINGFTAIATAVSTLVMAVSGFGYWALVLANLVTALSSTVLMFASRPTRIAWPRFSALRAATAISIHVTFGRLAWFVWSNADYVVAGKVLGETALGFYSFAFMLASLPVDKISSIVTKVSTAFMSAVQTEPADLRRYLLSLTEGLALVAFPLAWGLALVAEDFVPLLLGDKWLGLIPPLQILAFYASVRAVDPVLAPVLNVTGQTRFGMQMSILFAVILPIGFIVGSRWGVVGIAGAWVALHPLFMGSLLWRVTRVIDLRFRTYFGATWPAFSSACLMAIAVVLVGRIPWPEGLLAVELAAKVVAGAATYCGSMLLFFRSRLKSALDTLRHVKRR